MSKFLTIDHVPNDKRVIVLMLEYLQLCKVSSICVFPDFQRGKLCHTAFVEVASWIETESAYNLIKAIKNPMKEARINYSDDQWWAVEETAEEDKRFLRDAVFQKWTATFVQAAPDKPERSVSFKRGLDIEECIFIEKIEVQIDWVAEEVASV